ncbi:SGNH/GDSL hydrolase family protein [Actinoplanes sp. NPDC051494]|uniref:SGNH/GDSL hydrolase family protein n=1 Tax=Actinoplanes sp. NPDC051494 TaxID=3363907 RepID=UPI0037943CB1
MTTAVATALLVASCSAAPPPAAPLGTAPQPVPVTTPPPATKAPMVRIMPLGDSITAGARSSDESGYRTDLLRLLTRAGWRVDMVGSQESGDGPDPDHEGHSGWTMTQLARRLDGWLARSRPDVILLHAGTNDLRDDQDAQLAPQVLTRILARIARDRPGAQVFVAQIIGNRDLGDGAVRQRRADAYNAQVPAIVAAAGPNFHLVDQRAVRGRDLADKLHPADRGYRRMARTWFAALQEL